MAKLLKSASMAFWMAFLFMDIVGVIGCFVLDVVPNKYHSPLMAYAVWFVLGVFAGIMNFNAAQSFYKGKDGTPVDWDSPDEARKIGGSIVAITAGYLTLLTVLSYLLFWSSFSTLETEFLVVPDHMGASLTFFIVFLATTAFANHLFAPTPKKA